MSKRESIDGAAGRRGHREGTEVAGAHAPGAHGEHASHDSGMFRRKFWWSLILTVPIVVTSHMVMEWFGYRLDFAGMWLIGPVLGSVVFFYGGGPFLIGAVTELRSRAPGMMMLISLAIVVAYLASMATSFGWFDLDFWWELAALVTVMLLGHWQEMKAIGRAEGALAALAALLPDTAERATGSEIETVPVADVKPGDVVLVRSGARVPADGRVVEGRAELDESMITGESRTVVREVGDVVVAGTVATDSALRVSVEAVGDDTTLAGIQRMVEQAQRSSGRGQVLADRFAGLLFYLAVVAAVVAFAAWWLLGDVSVAVARTVTVLVIACPHALGLAIPLVIALSTAVAAKGGILVKDRLALERMRTVDTVLFDKTGTLTTGAHLVSEVASGANTTTDEVLRLAGAVESDSEHPLARAIVTAAGGSTDPADGFQSMTGRGVKARVAGRWYAVGGPALTRELTATIPPDLDNRGSEWSARGASVLYLWRLGTGATATALGALALEDTARPEAGEAIELLRKQGVGKIVMITGDARPVAEAVARQVGFGDDDEVFAEVLPADKDRAVMELQARGLTVAMVGDGVNDAPALARADVGIAIGAGTDVAIESAGVVLASSDPRGVAAVRSLSGASYRKMIQNLVWAAGYNVVAIPLAAGALSWAGVTLSPAVGAILMSVSTIVVALNAQLLRRVDLVPGRRTGFG